MVAKINGMQIVGANCRHTCAVVKAGANSKDWGQLWAQQVAQISQAVSVHSRGYSGYLLAHAQQWELVNGV